MFLNLTLYRENGRDERATDDPHLFNTAHIVRAFRDADFVTCLELTTGETMRVDESLIAVMDATRDPPAPPARVWIAEVTHQHGTNTYLARSERGAMAALATYCRENWPRAGDPPEDDGQAVDAYFADPPKYPDGSEDYNVNEVEVRD